MALHQILPVVEELDWYNKPWMAITTNLRWYFSNCVPLLSAKYATYNIPYTFIYKYKFIFQESKEFDILLNSNMYIFFMSCHTIKFENHWITRTNRRDTKNKKENGEKEKVEKKRQRIEEKNKDRDQWRKERKKERKN